MFFTSVLASLVQIALLYPYIPYVSVFILQSDFPNVIRIRFQVAYHAIAVLHVAIGSLLQTPDGFLLVPMNLDALRAIDEAVLFLDLRPGSRLGHATLLGINAISYYQFRYKNEISIPKGVFLDNIVWMKAFIHRRNINIREHSSLMQFLDDEFQKLFPEIYGKALKYMNILHPNEDFHITPQSDMMTNCYYAWLLRGDDPQMYQKLNSVLPLTVSEEYRLCNSIPEINKARRKKEAQILYHLYHYNLDVKVEGEKPYKVHLPMCFVEAIQAIQQHMRIKLTRQGISIETNPSSNLFIGPIDCLVEHPISVFYDNRLKIDRTEVQMNVSINTDDKSLFSTCLPNEYAYLAYALENAKDDNGNDMYKHFDVFQWIDEIRIMGNEQSFMIIDGQ